MHRQDIEVTAANIREQFQASGLMLMHGTERIELTRAQGPGRPAFTVALKQEADVRVISAFLKLVVSYVRCAFGMRSPATTDGPCETVSLSACNVFTVKSN